MKFLLPFLLALLLLWDSPDQPVGTVFEVFTSPDLQSWGLLATVPYNPGVTNYSLPVAAAAPAAFYKLAARHDGIRVWVGGLVERIP